MTRRYAVSVQGDGRLGGWVLYPFEALIAALMVISGLSNVLTPERVAPTAPLWTAYATAVMYLIGGLLILLGLLRSWVRVEAVGLVMLIGGLTITTIAAFTYGTPTEYARAVTFIAVVVAATIRLRTLFRVHT